MSRGKYGKRGSRKRSEPLRWKLGASINSKVWGKLDASEQRQLMHQAASHFIQTGEQLEGVQLIGRWKNPENKQQRHQNWKTSDFDGQTLGGFFDTIHGARRRYADYDGPQRKPMGRATAARREAPVLGPATRRSAAQSAYQSELRVIREKHPKWNQQRVREKYRAQRAATVAREQKAKAKAKGKK